MQVVVLIRWSDFGGDSKREGDREFRVLAKEWVKGWSTGARLEGEGFGRHHHLSFKSLRPLPPSWTLASGYVTLHHMLPGAAHNSLDVWD